MFGCYYLLMNSAANTDTTHIGQTLVTEYLEGASHKGQDLTGPELAKLIKAASNGTDLDGAARKLNRQGVKVWGSCKSWNADMVFAALMTAPQYYA